MPLYFENEEVQNSTVTTYNELPDKPTVNGVTIEGDLLLADIGLGNVMNFCGEVEQASMLPAISNKGDVYIAKDNKTVYIFDSIQWVKLAVLPSENTVLYKDFVHNGQLRKTIELANYNSISGLDTEAVGHNLVMVSKWNVADFGGPALHLNLNTKDNVTINDSKVIATADDVATKASNIELTSLLSRVKQLEAKVETLNKTNVEPVIVDQNTVLNLVDTSKDYIVEGTLSNNASIKGKSVTLKNIQILNATKLVTYSKDFTASNINVEGNYESKAGKVFDLNDSEYVTIKGTTFNANTAYNIIEVGLNGSTLPKNVLIEDCKFLGEYTNNAILIFGTQDNAVININNCYFQKLSNVLRLSNRTNAKNVVVNITNCKCDYWDVNPEFAGMIICQDYTSKSLEEMQKNNLFGDGKITINISNFEGPNGKVVSRDINLLCGSQTQDQILYLWDTTRKTSSYDAHIYPLLTIN